jgi:DNA-binding MarR family transcriptional regulator
MLCYFEMAAKEFDMGPETIKISSDLANSSDLEEFVGYNLKRAYMIVLADFRRALKQDDLSTRLFSALSLVVEYPNITQSALAKMLGIERSGLVAMVDELEERGFVTRATVPTDRRIQALVPSKAGQKAYQQALAKAKAHEDQLFAHFTDEEREQLLTLLKKIRLAEGGELDG